MKTLKILLVMTIGLSLVLAASSAIAGGKDRRGGPSYGAYPHRNHVYVERHVHKYSLAPHCSWGYFPAPPPRVYAAPVYRGYCAPYPPPYTYGRVYRPGWSFAFSFGW